MSSKSFALNLCMALEVTYTSYDDFMVFIQSKAVNDDIDLLFQWANDPVVRQNSFNSNPIPYEDHVAWFQRMMGNENIFQYILMEDKEPVGQIRLTIENDEAEIGYSIASNQRGKGYGHRILQLIVEEIKDNYPGIKCLIAKVKPDNKASNRLFVGEGYKLNYVEYSKALT